MYYGDSVETEKVKIPCGQKDHNGNCLDGSDKGININIHLENNDSNPKSSNWNSENRYKSQTDRHDLTDSSKLNYDDSYHEDSKYSLNEGEDNYYRDSEDEAPVLTEEQQKNNSVPDGYKKKPKVVNVQLPSTPRLPRKPKTRFFHREFI